MAEFEDDAALVSFEDDLRFALAHKAPRGVVSKLPKRFFGWFISFVWAWPKRRK
jgi:hypothetical protein